MLPSGYLAPLVLAATLAAPGVVVVDRDDTPVPGASVVFIAEDGSQDVEIADAGGRASPHAGFEPTHVQISASNCAARSTKVSSGEMRIPLACSLEVIGRVRVATGSNQSLHALPFAASVLDRAAIAANPSTTGDAMLRTLPGFDRDRSNSAFTNYGQLRVSFDGAGNDRGLVLADGIPAQDGFGGQIDWAAYPTADITRAELLRGPGSALYGAGAIGGVLSLDTFGPMTGVRDGTLTFAAGSRTFSTWYGAFTAPLSSKWSASFSSQQQRLAYDDLTPAYTSTIDMPAQAKDDMLTTRVRYAAGFDSIFEYGYRGAWDYQQEGRRNYDFWRRLVQHNVRYLHSTDRGQVAIDYFIRSAFVTNRADQAPADPGLLRYTQYVPTSESGASATWNVDSAESSFQLRGDARFIRGLSDQFGPDGAFQSSGSGQQHVAGLAMQDTLRDRGFELVGGARFDVGSFFDGMLVRASAVSPAPPRTDRAVSPRVAARLEVNKHLALRVSEGSGIRFPFLNELVRGFVIGGVSYLPNSALIPERSSSGGGGLDWSDDRQRLSLEFTQTLVHDAIMFRTVNAKTQVRSNVDGTQTDGTALTYTRLVGACSRVSLSGASQYARVTAGNAAIVGKRLQYVPQASTSLAFDGPIGKIGAGASISYLGQTYADDLNAQPLGSALVMAAHLALPIRAGASIVINAENLTDARYHSSIDRYGPPSIISIGLRVPLATRAVSTSSPCPRTL